MNTRLTLTSLLIFLVLGITPACSQKITKTQLTAPQKAAPRLIVRADDMGFSHAANAAILKTMKEGIATSVEVLVPSPWFPEAVKMLQENPQFDVGVHLALTSEWSNTKFRPVSNSPSLTNDWGYFHAYIWPNEKTPGEALREHSWTIADVEKEFRAQIELALKTIPQTSHISAHMGCYEMDPEVKAMTKRLAKEYNIDIDPEELGIQRVRYVGSKNTTEEKVQSIIKMLESLKPGETYFFVDHPGLNTPELQAINHEGNNKVALDRQGVTDSWTDPRVKAAIQKLGIQLISYADAIRQ